MNQETKKDIAPAEDIVFSKVKAGDPEELAEIIKIYTESFPANERQPLQVLKQRIRAGQNEVYIGRIGNETVFIALLWPLTGTDFILLDYMATSPAWRERNIGSAFLQKMYAELEKINKYFVLEVEDPEYGDNQEQRKKRFQFYKKNGAVTLSGVQYILPALDGSKPTEMLLMIFPGKAGEKIEATLVNELMVRIYRELYNADATELIRSNGLEKKEQPIYLI